MVRKEQVVQVSQCRWFNRNRKQIEEKQATLNNQNSKIENEQSSPSRDERFCVNSDSSWKFLFRKEVREVVCWTLKVKRCFIFFSFLFIYYFICQNFWKENWRGSMVFYCISVTAGRVFSSSFSHRQLSCCVLLPPPAQPTPPRADWGGRRRSAEVFCPTALIPTDISFLISRPLSLQSRCFFSCSVWVRFFFFRERRRTHAGWPDEFHVHLL